MEAGTHVEVRGNLQEAALFRSSEAKPRSSTLVTSAFIHFTIAQMLFLLSRKPMTKKKRAD